ncbi:MAG: DUF6105 family protein [Pseudomonadota bacterium]
MRYIFYFWFLPMSLFWGWFYLASNDINFGLSFFSKANFDIVFAIYKQVTGLEQAQIISIIAKACIVDTFIIFGIYAFRKRREIKAWWNKSASEPASLQSSSSPIK